jgi:hypothetical protein
MDDRKIKFENQDILLYILYVYKRKMKCTLDALKFPLSAFIYSNMDIQSRSLEIIFTGFEAIPKKVVYSLPKCLIYHLERGQRMAPLIDDLVEWVKKARYQDRNLDWTVVRFRLSNHDQSVYKTFSIITTTDKKNNSNAFYTELPCTLTWSFEKEKRHIPKGVSTLTDICVEHLSYDERMYIAKTMHFGINVFTGIAWNIL